MKLFLCLVMFCAAALLIFFGTVSPCQIMRQDIRQGMALNKDSESDLVSIFLTDSVIDNQITQHFGKYPTPILCTRWLFGFLRPYAEVQSNQNTQKAIDSDSLISGARLCTAEFPKEEKEYKIPTHLLAAISITESGRFDKDLGIKVPWPWTIRADGKKYYFNSEAEAVAQTQHLMGQHTKDIALGCFQPKLRKYDLTANEIEDIFKPENNVRNAAIAISNNYKLYGDWVTATAAYHSSDPKEIKEYLSEIQKNWDTIVAKVAEARNSKTFK